MARFAEEEIQRLKREISVAELARARGMVLTKSGEDFIGLCPFHDDREPSMIITPSNNLWHCLGACQAGGSVIDFVMRAHGVSFRHAVELLQRGRGGTSAAASGEEPMVLDLLAPAGVTATELLEAVTQHYHCALLKDAGARAYLGWRGLDRADVIEHFRLGFVDRTLGYRVPHIQRKLGKELRTKLTEVGVLRDSGHEHLRGCVVVPLMDAEGRVVQLYGRKVDDTKEPRHLYLKGPHRGVFNRAGLEGAEEVIVCEAVLDAMTFWAHGFTQVTSGYGIEGVTEEILEAIVSSGAKVVKIAFDRDEAGDRGAMKLAERLGRRGLEVYRVVFPRGMDANEYARKVEPAPRSLGLVLRQAEWMRGSRVVSNASTSAASDVEVREVAHAVEPAAFEADAGMTDAELLSLAASVASLPEQTPARAREGAGPSSLETGGLAELGAAPMESASPPASAAPQLLELERNGEDLFANVGNRRWRMRWMGKASGSELRVNLLVSDEREGGRFFVDTVDLYSARQRTQFTKSAAEELGGDEQELRRETGALVLALEQERTKRGEPVKPRQSELSEEEREEAMKLLRDPELATRIVEDLGRAGIVGEETNKLVTYLAATSRKLEEPLAVVIQSSSAAGKSSLMEAVLALMPEEERVQYSAMTGQSLFYMSGQDLKHKILAIVEEEGAERAAYALKLLQSEGELTIASTGKDPTTGRHVTQTYRVEGPVMIVLTTTASEVDEELLNRCLVLTVDEGQKQTRAIHERQRATQTIEGQIERVERSRIRRVHKNAQRLLKPVLVANPYAPSLDFASHVTRTRRDHMKYLTLIRAVTLLFQHQRPLKTTHHRGERIEYIESTKEDVELGTRLARAVLGRSLDELPPQTRRLLEEIGLMVTAWAGRERMDKHAVRFRQRDVREWTHWGQTQVKVHMKRLEEHEYVLVHRGRGPATSYELAYFELPGVSLGGRGITGVYEGDRSGSDGARSGVGRASVAAWSGLGRGGGNEAIRSEKAMNGVARSEVVENAFVEGT